MGRRKNTRRGVKDVMCATQSTQGALGIALGFALSGTRRTLRRGGENNGIWANTGVLL